MEISDKGLSFIKSFEGLCLTPYLDNGGIPTIGYGTVYYPDGTRVRMSDPAITQDDALRFLRWGVNDKCESLNNMVTVELNQNQFDALCSLVYNIGAHAFQKSTLLFLLNQGMYGPAANQFVCWDRAGGQIVQGLLTRRQKETELFLTEET